MKRSSKKKKTIGNALRKQMKKKIKKERKSNKKELWISPKGSDKWLVSTGSTLLNQAITGKRFKGGGIPVGILCEIFGPSGLGKTVLLLEMAGDVQRQGGDYLFLDPEARVNPDFAKLFDFDLEEDKYHIPITIEETFKLARHWEPLGNGPHVIFVDSVAALLSNMETGDDQDKMGGRRAKEFSEQTRKICTRLTEDNILMVCTNQIRQNMNTGYGKKYTTTGGEALKFYSSLRLELKKPFKEGVLTKKKTIRGVEHTHKYGIQTNIQIEKSSVSAPHQEALVRILFDYGVDDISVNLHFLKRNTKSSSYILGDRKLGRALKKAVSIIESEHLEAELRSEVISLWLEIQKELTPDRIRKRR